jgi:hypothetical protein
MEPIREFNRELIAEGAKLIEQWEAACARHEAQMRASPMLPPTNPPPRPALPRATFDDVTVQKMVRILNDNPKGLLCFKDELSGFFQGLTRFANGGSDAEHWLKSFNGAEIVIDRVGDSSKKKPEMPIVAPEPYVSILGGIPPGILAKHLNEENQSCGLIPRFLFTMPPRVPKRWSREGFSDKARKRWRKLVRGLCELEWTGETIDLGPDVEPLWEGFFNLHSDLLNEASGHTASHLSKLEAVTARVALLFCVTDRMSSNKADTGPIEPVWVESAIRFTQWMIRERKRIEQRLTKLSGAGTSLGDRVHVFVRQGGPDGLTTTDIHRKLSNNFGTEEVHKALADLETQGLIVREERKAGTKPTQIWRSLGGFLKPK